MGYFLVFDCWFRVIGVNDFVSILVYVFFIKMVNDEMVRLLLGIMLNRNGG